MKKDDETEQSGYERMRERKQEDGQEEEEGNGKEK